MSKGKLIGVGVGPGDSELLTIKAYKILNEVDVICSPHSSEGKDSVALKIVKPYLKRTDEYKLLEPLFPMTEDEEELEKNWDICANQIRKELDQNLNVAFITLGDPTIFSTFSYIQKRLEEDYEVEIIPGIPSFTACASSIKKSLIEKDEILTIIPKIDERFEDLAKNSDTLILMKTSRHVDEINKIIKATHKKSEVKTVQKATEKDEKIIDGFAKDKTYFSTSIIKFNK